MKKIYFIASVVLLTLFTACEDFNEKNFLGYEEAAKPTNITNYKYELVAADYTNIGNEIKKPIEDLITIQNNLVINKKAELETAENAVDSLRINSELVGIELTTKDSINKLKLDSLYILGASISKNKYFVDSLQFTSYIPKVLAKKYLFADTSSIANVSFKFNVPIDTTSISSVDKYELAPIDYTNMGLTVGNLSFKSANPNHFLPIWLKTKFTYANSGATKLIRYLYDNGNSPIYKAYKVYVYNGDVWTESLTTNTVSAKFVLKEAGWKYTPSEVFSELFSADLGSFTSIQISGKETNWTWASYKGEGYAYANAYQKGAIVMWIVSQEIILPDNENLVIYFNHAINFFTSEMNLSELTTLNISTDYSDDVESATWDKLEIAYPAAPSWTFIKSGNISLKNYANKKIRIGFRYETLENNQEAWEIKAITIK